MKAPNAPFVSMITPNWSRVCPPIVISVMAKRKAKPTKTIQIVLVWLLLNDIQPCSIMRYGLIQRCANYSQLCRIQQELRLRSHMNRYEHSKRRSGAICQHQAFQVTPKRTLSEELSNGTLYADRLSNTSQSECFNMWWPYACAFVYFYYVWVSAGDAP